MDKIKEFWNKQSKLMKIFIPVAGGLILLIIIGGIIFKTTGKNSGSPVETTPPTVTETSQVTETSGGETQVTESTDSSTQALETVPNTNDYEHMKFYDSSTMSMLIPNIPDDMLYYNATHYDAFSATYTVTVIQTRQGRSDTTTYNIRTYIDDDMYYMEFSDGEDSYFYCIMQDYTFIGNGNDIRYTETSKFLSSDDSLINQWDRDFLCQKLYVNYFGYNYQLYASADASNYVIYMTPEFAKIPFISASGINRAVSYESGSTARETFEFSGENNQVVSLQLYFDCSNLSRQTQGSVSATATYSYEIDQELKDRFNEYLNSLNTIQYNDSVSGFEFF